MIRTPQGLPAGAVLSADICVVGAGPAGIALALECAQRGASVLIIESGGMRPDAESQALCAGEVDESAPHPPADTYRRRALGGSSTIWGGRCAPLDPIDFEPRPWLGLPGWPVNYETLRPYWLRACSWAELGDCAFQAATAIPGGMRPMLPGFDNPWVSTESVERFSRPTNFGARYRKALEDAPGITVLLHTVCTGIRLNESRNRVDRLELRTADGTALTVGAPRFVLAAGGLETPRLLLASRADLPCGVGNAYAQVGRHYMCHMAGTVGIFRARAGVPPFHGYERSPDGVYCRRRLAVTAAAQRSFGMGNAIARLHHPRLADAAHGSGPLSALYLARKLLPYEYTIRLAGSGSAAPAHAANIARAPWETARFLAALGIGRFVASRKLPSIIAASPAGSYTLDLHAEQLPNPESRITLADTKDRFGTPRLRIAWRYQASDLHTARTAVGLIGAALQEGGHGSFTCDPEEVDAAMVREGAYGGHHLGTARMAEDRRNGVVDSDCRVFGMSNLYIGGGAVFPTSGQANPTLTILALAIRLADHLMGLSAAGREEAFSIPELRAISSFSIDRRQPALSEPGV